MSPESNIHEDIVGKNEVDPQAIARMKAAQRRLAELSAESDVEPDKKPVLGLDEEKYQAIKRDLLLRARGEDEEAES